MRCARCKTAGVDGALCVACRHELEASQIDAERIARLFADACAHMASEQPSKAVRSLQMLLRRDAGHVMAYEALILAYGQMAKLERALDALNALHHVDPSFVAAPATRRASPARGRRATSVRATERLMAETPCTLVDLALFYRQMHQLDLAERVLLQVLAKSKDCADAHLVLGSVLRARGKPRLALTALKKAVSRGEVEHAAVAYETGLCQEMLGQAKKAIQSVSSAIALEPDNPHMHLTLGMLYEKQGRPRLARRAYRVAASLHGAFAPALVDISFRLGLNALDEGNLERAVAEFSAGLSENEALFAPAVLQEIDHLVSHLVEAEQFRTWLEGAPAVQGLPMKALSDLEDAFGLAARLGFFVGLHAFWEGTVEDEETGVEAAIDDAPGVEMAEPEATWLEGFSPGGRYLRGATPPPSRVRVARKARGRRQPADEEAEAKARLSRPETALGFPPVPFEFVFEEWLNVQSRLASPRIAERPLVPPDIYHRLIEVLGHAVGRARIVLEREGVIGEDEEPDAGENVDLGLALWATIVEAYLLREALERCRRYPPKFLLQLAVAERYRQRRLFPRAIRAFEAAIPLLPENVSIRNFAWNLCIREGRYAEAIEHCHAVLRFTPHYLFQAAAYNDLAHCLVERDENPKLALLYTEKARELAPHLFDAHVADTKAWLSCKEGRYDEALQLIEQVIAAGCSDEHALLPTSMHFYHYGHILQGLGQQSEAQEAFATAREMEVDADSDWGITRRLRKERRRAR